MRKLSEGKLVVASHNAGKVKEIKDLLREFGVAVTSSAELGLEEPEETEDSFEGNARIKAHFAARESGLPALSDDSGIAVEALNGAPGVYTANWAETPEGRDWMLAMSKVWQRLEELKAPMPRRAAFHCTLCLAWPDGHDAIFNGRVAGTLTWPVRGTRGFGYDPMFVPEGWKMSFGEMEPEQKHAISHRADAFKKLVNACFRDSK